MQVDGFVLISSIIATIGCVMGVMTYTNNRKKDVVCDTEENAESRAKISVKLDVICNTTNDIKVDIRNINSQLREVIEKQIRQEMEIKTLWKKVDTLEEYHKPQGQI